jgi:hypothetical protein
LPISSKRERISQRLQAFLQERTKFTRPPDPVGQRNGQGPDYHYHARDQEDDENNRCERTRQAPSLEAVDHRQQHHGDHHASTTPTTTLAILTAMTARATTNSPTTEIRTAQFQRSTESSIGVLGSGFPIRRT